MQHLDGFCSYPHSVCFTAATMDGKALPADNFSNPFQIRVPRSGIFKVSKSVTSAYMARQTTFAALMQQTKPYYSTRSCLHAEVQMV